MSDKQLTEYQRVGMEEGVDVKILHLEAFGPTDSFCISKNGAHSFLDTKKVSDPEQLRRYIKRVFYTKTIC